MKAPWLKEKGDRHVCVVRARGRRSGMDDPVRVDRLVGPTVWGDDRSPAVAGPRVGGIGAARVHGIRRPGPGAAHIHPSRNSCRSAAFDRCGFMDRGCHAQSAGDRRQRRRAILACQQRSGGDPTTNARSIGRSHDSAVRNRQQVTRAGIARVGPTRRLEGALEGGPRCCEFMTSELIHPFAPCWSLHL
jgi:hypothetical protein